MTGGSATIAGLIITMSACCRLLLSDGQENTNMTDAELDRMRALAEAARYQSAPWSREYAQDLSKLMAELERMRVALGARNTEAEIIFLDKIERLQSQLNDTRAMLRIECARFEDNDWADDLHLADVVEKHLARPAWNEIRRLRQIISASPKLEAQIGWWCSRSNRLYMMRDTQSSTHEGQSCCKPVYLAESATGPASR